MDEHPPPLNDPAQSDSSLSPLAARFLSSPRRTPRELAEQNDDGGRFVATLADGRPYFPNLTADASDPASVRDAALASVALSIFVAAAKNAGDVDAGGGAGGRRRVENGGSRFRLRTSARGVGGVPDVHEGDRRDH